MHLYIPQQETTSINVSSQQDTTWYKDACSRNHAIKHNTDLHIPYMNTLVERTTSEVFSIRTEGYTVHRFLMAGQGVNAQTAINIPESHC